ncbi:MAG: hypothetical protein DWP98_03675 [Bacteroidetes bacterium]|nr:MAG: hypothetical protein DWP98_03675 [Bacteroidota bacterium]MBL1144232.1 hypothetical protein [Bacteroidota bacterium]MCB0801934.1 hypothetical protein [Flavobacteriales bacterium]NOG57028.1 hypothetical protein [Bacteroidota bacterium]
MKKLTILISATILLCLANINETQAQCDTIASICSQNFSKNYLSDGQEYRALLFEEQTAEFHLTLYGGSVYRFSACSGLSNGNLIFRVLDEEMNELFTNKDYEVSPYWDFEVESTLDVIVEGNLNLEKVNSGCAVLLVGFKP